MLMKLTAGDTVTFCVGDYQWIVSSTSGMFDLASKFAVVGANELLPCGID
jgi:hypothetical protein